RLVEEAELDAGGVLGEEREVDSLSIPGCAERIGLAGPDAHRALECSNCRAGRDERRGELRSGCGAVERPHPSGTVAGSKRRTRSGGGRGAGCCCFLPRRGEGGKAGGRGGRGEGGGGTDALDTGWGKSEHRR